MSCSAQGFKVAETAHPETSVLGLVEQTHQETTLFSRADQQQEHIFPFSISQECLQLQVKYLHFARPAWEILFLSELE